MGCSNTLSSGKFVHRFNPKWCNAIIIQKYPIWKEINWNHWNVHTFLDKYISTFTDCPCSIRSMKIYPHNCRSDDTSLQIWWHIWGCIAIWPEKPLQKKKTILMSNSTEIPVWIDTYDKKINTCHILYAWLYKLYKKICIVTDWPLVQWYDILY